jgi:O6-methylguanine-DNA--protein-cysteine methyltransferase
VFVFGDSATGSGGFAWGLTRKRRWLKVERDGLAG